MILGPKKLLQLVKKIKLVEDLSERELTNPEGAGFDLRLGEIYKISGSAFLGETHRETPKIKLIVKYEDKRVNKVHKVIKVVVKPGDFYLATTIEAVNLPQDIVATFIPRTTTFRSGIFIRTGVAQPGYHGKLTFAIKNEGPIPVTLEMGCRFVHVRFEWVDGGGSMYRGQWQGGRVTTKRKEKQV